jgi:mono/diheme cytochrome c family protein
MRYKECILAGLLVSGLTALAQTPPSADRWDVPRRAAARKNPVAANETSIALGKNTYERHCLSCHGAKGKGDGPAAAQLEMPPTDLSNPKLWGQSDGALLWKVTEGHKPMPTFKNITSDEERWPLINFMRTLAPKPSAPDQPKAEKPKGETNQPPRETKP